MMDTQCPACTSKLRVLYVVPMLNARHFLEPCLRALTLAAERAEADATIVVVDNGSTDGSVEYVSNEFPDVILARRPGVTIGTLRNHGAGMAHSDYVAFVDADCVVDLDHTNHAADVLRTGRIHATGATYALPAEPTRTERVWQRLHERDRDGPVKYIPSGNLVCVTDAFWSVGGFDEGLTTGEDAELCQRLRRAGYAVEMRRAVRAVHLGNPKSIGDFYRKQAWHAEGMFGTARRELLDRPLILTIVFIVCVLAALAIVAAERSLAATVGAAVLLFAAPALAVLVRAIEHRRVPELYALVLYLVYLSARARVLLLGPASKRMRTRHSDSRAAVSTPSATVDS